MVVALALKHVIPCLLDDSMPQIIVIVKEAGVILVVLTGIAIVSRIDSLGSKLLVSPQPSVHAEHPPIPFGSLHARGFY